jgi:hypothetical protein
MTFLSKIGAVLLKGIGLATGFLPLISSQIPQASGAVQVISKDLAELSQVVISVEAIGQLKGLPGADKAKAAGPLVAQVILRSTLLTGQKIQNPDLFNQGCVNIAGGLADVLNSLHPDGVQEKDVKA